MSATGSGPRQAGDGVMAAALAAGATHAGAAARAGVSPRTVRRRLEDPDFRALVEQMGDQIVVEVLEALRDHAVAAVATLAQLALSGHPDHVRLGAAKAVLDLLVRYRDIGDVERRLRALEAGVPIDVLG